VEITSWNTDPADMQPREAFAWTASPKKRPLAGGAAGPSESGRPEVVGKRGRNTVGEPGMPSPAHQLMDHIRLPRRGCCQAIVISWPGPRSWLPRPEFPQMKIDMAPEGQTPAGAEAQLILAAAFGTTEVMP
jgi:hypothetical protein